MNKEDIIEAGKIINEFEIQQGFECYNPKFSNPCKVEDIGLDSFVACLINNPKGCIFSLSFGNTNFCKSPFLVHSAKTQKVKR